jgi:chromosome partitioning protein
MAIITFANPKGGSGKTTAAVILATTLAEQGASVTIIDADPERWASRWLAASDDAKGITVTSADTSDILDRIEDATAQTAFVVVDTEGTASSLSANAAGFADLVLIPAQGSSLDARGAVKALGMVRDQSRIARRPIPAAVVLTRTSAAIETRALRHIRDGMAEAGVHVLRNSLVERAAFRDLLDYGGTLSDLDKGRVGNLEKAIANAEAFAGEVVEYLKEGIQHEQR